MITNEAHFAAYHQARAHLLALANTTAVQLPGYDGVLLALDELHEPDDWAPARPLAGIARRDLYQGAVDALTDLRRNAAQYGLDRLALELCADDLATTWASEQAWEARMVTGGDRR